MSGPLHDGAPGWHLDDLVETGEAALAAGISDVLRDVDGRWVWVMASPGDGATEHMAVGLSVLPAGYSTPPHAHHAEELAIVLEGRGAIEIEARTVDVSKGSVVPTPSGATHRTIAESALTILWVYAPAGDEQRWKPEQESRKESE